MLIFVVSPQPKKRKAVIEKFLSTQQRVELVHTDDSMSTLADLENFVYPSLFSEVIPVIIGLHLVESVAVIDDQLLATLANSPTIFILEEIELSALVKKKIEKSGGSFLLHDIVIKKEKKVSPLFSAATILCTSHNRKDVWLTLQQALQEESPEALIGILYWKLRQLIEKDTGNEVRYKNLYHQLMKAQAVSWTTGVPLELELEKVFLQK